MLGVFSELERAIIRERIKTGLARARAEHPAESASSTMTGIRSRTGCIKVFVAAVIRVHDRSGRSSLGSTNAAYVHKIHEIRWRRGHSDSTETEISPSAAFTSNSDSKSVG